MHKLQPLIQTLKNLHLTEEVSTLQKLADYSAPPWLEEWRDCMRHYGFQSFNHTKSQKKKTNSKGTKKDPPKWHKGKSFLMEPLDEASALQDIHLVEQAHSPDAEGRRISNTALDNFMKEFYGELITQAPRDGWKKKMNHKAKRLKA
jgi:hypothetical protein